MTLIRTYDEWVENGHFWCHGNIACTIMKRGINDSLSASMSEILIRSGCAYKTKESLLEHLREFCHEVDIKRNQFLNVADIKSLKWDNIRTLDGVFEYLDNLEPDNKIRKRWIPKKNILMRDEINKETLSEFDIHIRPKWIDKILEFLSES